MTEYPCQKRGEDEKYTKHLWCGIGSTMPRMMDHKCFYCDKPLIFHRGKT